MREALSKLVRKVRGLFPSALPQGVTEFEEWAKSIASTYWLPTINDRDIKFVLTSMIMRLGPLAAYKSKYYFVLALRASAAKQVAGYVFSDIKTQQQQEQQKAIKEQAAATALAVVSNAQQEQSLQPMQVK